MSTIRTKQEFMRLSEFGMLGNSLRIWGTVEDFHKDPYCGYVTLRAHDKQSPWFVSVCHSDWETCGRGGKRYLTVGQELQRIWKDGGPDSDAFYIQEIPHPECIRAANIEIGRMDFAPEFSSRVGQDKKHLVVWEVRDY